MTSILCTTTGACHVITHEPASRSQLLATTYVSASAERANASVGERVAAPSSERVAASSSERVTVSTAGRLSRVLCARVSACKLDVLTPPVIAACCMRPE